MDGAERAREISGAAEGEGLAAGGVDDAAIRYHQACHSDRGESLQKPARAPHLLEYERERIEDRARLPIRGGGAGEEPGQDHESYQGYLRKHQAARNGNVRLVRFFGRERHGLNGDQQPESIGHGAEYATPTGWQEGDGENAVEGNAGDYCEEKTDQRSDRGPGEP